MEADRLHEEWTDKLLSLFGKHKGDHANHLRKLVTAYQASISAVPGSVSPSNTATIRPISIFTGDKLSKQELKDWIATNFGVQSLSSCLDSDGSYPIEFAHKMQHLAAATPLMELSDVHGRMVKEYQCAALRLLVRWRQSRRMAQNGRAALAKWRWKWEVILLHIKACTDG